MLKALDANSSSLRTNFSWIIRGNIVFVASQWGMLVVLAKLCSPEAVGRFALGLAVSAPVILLSNLQLRAVQVTDVKQQYRFGDYLGLRLLTSVAALIAIGIIAGAIASRETALTIVVVGLAKTFDSIAEVPYGLLQQHEQMESIAKSMMLKGPLSLVMLAAAVSVTRSVLWGSVGLVIVSALVLFTYDCSCAVRLLRRIREVGIQKVSNLELIRPYYTPDVMRRLSALALPLGLVMMLMSLQTNVPRYIIQKHFGEAEVGIFSALAYFSASGNTIMDALGQSAIPRLARLYAAHSLAAFTRLLLLLTGVGMAIGLAGVAAAITLGSRLLSLFYRDEYAARADVFSVVMVAAAVAYGGAFLGYGMTAARMFRTQLVLFGLSTLAIVVAAFWLVPAVGLIGGAEAILIGNVIRVGGSAAVMAHLVRSAPVSELDRVPCEVGRS